MGCAMQHSQCGGCLSQAEAGDRVLLCTDGNVLVNLRYIDGANAASTYQSASWA